MCINIKILAKASRLSAFLAGIITIVLWIAGLSLLSGWKVWAVFFHSLRQFECPPASNESDNATPYMESSTYSACFMKIGSSFVVSLVLLILGSTGFLGFFMYLCVR